MGALPVALTGRGHQVMTVAPRYKAYSDAVDTGFSVPVWLPCQHSSSANRQDGAAEEACTGCSQQGGCHGGPAARLFACTSRGVDRVFVDHPLYAELPSFNGTYTYTDAGSAPDLDLAHSVLCQAALAAPALLWHATADQQAHVMEQTLPQSLVGGIAHVAGQQRHPEAEALWQQVPRQQQGPSQRQGPSQQQVLPATTSNFIGSPERLVFVANDWPTAPLLLRLKHCCQSRQSRPPEEVDMVAAPPIPRLEHSLDRMNSQQPPSVLCPPSLPLQQPETADQLPFVYRPSLSDSKYLAELEHHIASQLSGARAVYCIHNLAYQGLFDRAAFPRLCLPSTALRPLVTHSPQATPAAQPELNWMQAALLSSDLVLTVSEAYAKEICEDTHLSCGLHSVLAGTAVKGIMNGLDFDEWDPSTDPRLCPGAQYTAASVKQGKAAAKAWFQQQHGLAVDPDVPLFAFVGRLAHQKGADVILAAAPAILNPRPMPKPGGGEARRRPRLQLVMLGEGEAWMEHALKGLQLSHPGEAVGITQFSEDIAHQLIAAADFLLMPSRFEPCGLVAMCAVRYGTVPIVTATGGLADLVNDEVGYTLEPVAISSNAMLRKPAISNLLATLELAICDFGSERHHRRQQHGMRLDCSWALPAQQWEEALQTCF